jgi:hypothetical protein
MFLLDFTHSPGSALLHGFMKGLAAPVVLYHQEYAPAVQNLTPVVVPSGHVTDRLAEDWSRIGVDMNNAVARYGSPATKTSR